MPIWGPNPTDKQTNAGCQNCARRDRKFKVTSSSGLLHVTPLAAAYHENAASYQAAHLFPFESFWNSQDGYTVTGWPNIASEYPLAALRYIIVQDP